MKVYKVGDSQTVICEHCGARERATFKLRDVPFSNGSGTAKNALVGVCDCCDRVCVIPHQSTPAIGKQLPCQRRAIESRLPAHMLDILGLAASELGADTDFVPTLVKYYIHLLATNLEGAAQLGELLKSELARGKADKRLSLKGRRVAEELEAVKATARVKTTTDLIKAIVLKINEDILLNKQAKSLAELRNVIAALA